MFRYKTKEDLIKFLKNDWDEDYQIKIIKSPFGYMVEVV